MFRQSHMALGSNRLRESHRTNWLGNTLGQSEAENDLQSCRCREEFIAFARAIVDGHNHVCLVKTKEFHMILYMCFWCISIN